MRQRNTTPHPDNGRVKKTVEFEPYVYKKAEALIRQDKRKPTLKTLLSDLLDAEHERRFAKGRA